MTTYHILDLIGDIDGVNRLFVTPTPYVSGTIKVIWNGQVVNDTDDEQGWIEINEDTIQTKIAPMVEDQLQAFYCEKTGIEGVVGSPFHPDNIYP